MENDEEQFLNTLVALASKQKRKTVELPDCKSLFLMHFNYLSEKNRWEIMADWFQDLKKRHLIDYSETKQNYDFSSRVPLPRRIKLSSELSNTLKTPESVKDYQWLPDLMFLARIKNLNKSTEAKFKHINEFMRKKDAVAIAISIKERSLQILGDEKALEPLAQRYKEHIDLQKKLNYFFTYEPIHGEIFPEALSHKIIILENRDTYSTFLRLNHELCPPYYHGVFYGQGNTVLNSFPNIIPKIDQNDEVFYFGDIDRRGIMIAQNLIDSWKALEPQRKIFIAEQYYWQILNLYRTIGLKIETDSKIKSTVLQEYYTSDLYTELKKILECDEHIPQEFLNYEVLKNSHFN